MNTNVGCIHCERTVRRWPHCSQSAACTALHTQRQSQCQCHCGCLLHTAHCDYCSRPTFAFGAFARSGAQAVSQVSRRRVPRNVGRERTCDLRRTSAEARRAQAVQRAYKRRPISIISLALVCLSHRMRRLYKCPYDALRRTLQQ